jgi:hypothetical protein
MKLLLSSFGPAPAQRSSSMATIRVSSVRPAFWSPWIVVIAAIVMVLTRVINAS